MDCENKLYCKNNTKCYRCNGGNLFVESNGSKPQYSKPKSSLKPTSKDKSWKHLEQDVADAINKVPPMAEARRARASGALWFEKGDVVDSIVHFECKEREGYTVAQGKDKTFPMKRSWLEKAKEEADALEKPMMLPFRFVDDKNTYVAMTIEDIAELITQYKALKIEVDKKDALIKTLQSRMGE